MSERLRNIPETPLTYPNPHAEAVENEYYELELLKKLEKKAKRRQGLVLKMSALTLSLSTLSSMYWADVTQNQAEQDTAKISLTVIAPAINKANSHKATYFFDGFYTLNSDELAHNMSPIVQSVADSQIISVGYNNAILSRENIYKTILADANQNSVDEIAVFGRSAGGIMATEAAADIVKNSSIPVSFQILEDTPDGIEGLSQSQKSQLNSLQQISEKIPGAINSSAFRLAGEVFAHKDNFTQAQFGKWGDVPRAISALIQDGSNFIDTVNGAIEVLNGPNEPSTQLLTQQSYKLSEFDMSREMNDIASQDDKQRPVTLSVGSDDNSVVNALMSADNFAEDAKTANLRFLSYSVTGVNHWEYDKSLDQYAKAFDEASAPMAKDLQAEAGRYALILSAQELQREKDNVILAQK